MKKGINNIADFWLAKRMRQRTKIWFPRAITEITPMTNDEKWSARMSIAMQNEINTLKETVDKLIERVELLSQNIEELTVSSKQPQKDKANDGRTNRK